MTNSHNSDSQSLPKSEKEGFFDGMSRKEALKFKAQLLGLGAILTAAIVATPTALILHGMSEDRKATIKAEQTAQSQLHEKGIMLGFTAVANVDKSMSGITMQPIRTAVNISAVDFSHLPFHKEYGLSVAEAKLGRAEQYTGYAPDDNNGGFAVYGRMPGTGMPITNGSFGGDSSPSEGSYQVVPLYKAKNPKAATSYAVEVVASSGDTDIQAGAFVEKDGVMNLVVYNPQSDDNTELIVALYKK